MLLNVAALVFHLQWSRTAVRDLSLPPPRHHQRHVPVLGPAGSAGHLPQQQLLRTPDSAAAEQQGDFFSAVNGKWNVFFLWKPSDYDWYGQGYPRFYISEKTNPNSARSIGCRWRFNIIILIYLYYVRFCPNFLYLYFCKRKKKGSLCKPSFPVYLLFFDTLTEIRWNLTTQLSALSQCCSEEEL